MVYSIHVMYYLNFTMPDSNSVLYVREESRKKSDKTAKDRKMYFFVYVSLLGKETRSKIKNTLEFQMGKINYIYFYT